MAPRNSYVFQILLIFVVLNLTKAAVLNCSKLGAANCKAKFSEIFDRESETLHITYSKNLLNKYVETYNTILAELPENDKQREPIRKTIKQVTSKIESFNHGQENVKDTVGFMVTVEGKFEPDFTGIPFDAASRKQFIKLRKEHFKKLADYNDQEMLKMYDNIMDLWFQLYNGLSESDIKAYPDYTEVNRSFKALEAADASFKSILYWGAVEKATEFLQLDYYQKFLDELRLVDV